MEGCPLPIDLIEYIARLTQCPTTRLRVMNMCKKTRSRFTALERMRAVVGMAWESDVHRHFNKNTSCNFCGRWFLEVFGYCFNCLCGHDTRTSMRQLKCNFCAKFIYNNTEKRIEFHSRGNCLKNLVLKECKCGFRLSNKGIDSHDCIFKTFVCKKCHKDIPSRLALSHERKCTMQSEKKIKL
jgi:hypothetical protein